MCVTVFRCRPHLSGGTLKFPLCVCVCHCVNVLTPLIQWNIKISIVCMCVPLCQCVDLTDPMEQYNVSFNYVYVCLTVSAPLIQKSIKTWLTIVCMCRSHLSGGTLKFLLCVSVTVLISRPHLSSGTLKFLLCVCACHCVNVSTSLIQWNNIMWVSIMCMSISLCRPHWSRRALKYDLLLCVCVCHCV